MSLVYYPNPGLIPNTKTKRGPESSVSERFQLPILYGFVPFPSFTSANYKLNYLESPIFSNGSICSVSMYISASAAAKTTVSEDAIFLFDYEIGGKELKLLLLTGFLRRDKVGSGIDNRREDWMGNAATSKGYVEIEVNHELQKKLHFRSWLLGLNFKVHGLCCV